MIWSSGRDGRQLVITLEDGTQHRVDFRFVEA